MKQVEKKYIILGSLCALVLMLVVGYAAFNTVLKIKGTSNISSNWDIRITNITEKNIVGIASTSIDEEGNKKISGVGTLTATFETNLVSPSDSIEYDVTVSNKGNLNAKLDKITISESDNNAITFTPSGLSEGDVLNAGSNAVLTVKVEYNDVTSQPEKTIGTLKVTLDYSQADENKEELKPIFTNMKGIEVPVVSENDGLYHDEHVSDRYVYRGANPNNYITFNNEAWKIIALESDGTIKIMKTESIGEFSWDTSVSYRWERPATINTYLNNDYYNTLNSEAKSLIQTHAWGVGAVTYNNTGLAAQIADENSIVWNGNIGLMSVSDYLKADSDIEQCGTLDVHSYHCKTTNYIFKLIPASKIFWMISAVNNGEYSTYVYSINSYSFINSNYASNENGILPALYLKSDITLSGEGTASNPYTIN